MAGAGYRDWVAGDVPTATQFDTFLQEQTVMVFATGAARDAALSVPKSEGMLTYQLDTNTFTVYSGAAWSTVLIGHGVWTTWTPTVTQSGAVTVTNTASTYQRVGRMVTCRFLLAVTGSGTGANNVVLGGLPFTAATATVGVGAGYLLDASGVNVFTAVLYQESTTTLTMFSTSSSAANPRLGSTTFTAGLAAGDVLSGTFTYEAAADA